MGKVNYLKDLLLERVRSHHNKYLSAKLSLSAFALQIIVISINRQLLTENELASLLLSEVGAIAFFGILGLAWLVVATRRELPQVAIFRGKFAVINGLFWFIVSWALMIRFIYLLFVDLKKIF
ncbi:MAG TPA: hypothetical protein DCX53_04590 [Anaerolineae bacterium]|nr:hypothetical protein [Anaerolineae bacterium]